MDIFFTYMTVNVFILLVIGFFNPEASLFWLKGKLTRLKSALIYGILLVTFLTAYGVYIKANEPIPDENVSASELSSPGADYMISDTITMSAPNHNESSKDTQEENLKELINAVDIKNETTNDFAVRLASQFPGKYNVGQVCNIYSYIVRNWKYVNDSDKTENFRSASRSINNDLSGDCDDFAILMAAMVESIGGDARISFAYNSEGGHAFTEVLATNNEEDMSLLASKINNLYNDQFEVHYTKDDSGRCWLNLDWYGNPQYPGGAYFNYLIRNVFYPTISSPRYTTEYAQNDNN